ncbi:hypothetical protein F5Y00DRAFT_253818 [Daldinia vernicosa]|uniref:uncharacterized protein n=1 Tax=Daldinia vernicosa TaxID=114800 RepID=UPI0020073E75|nr:uncharacterized protein F5Y00DRAFT_253818 [Daldinia vernicosa]KAI0847603.1 hypothetical protein F5Y00DRAFT_253818 [Daldinia vernicosa]
MDNQIYDWDAELLRADWRNVDWRRDMHNFQRVPWAEIRTETLRQVAELHAQYDQTHPPSSSWPVRSPAAEELLRRQALDESNSGTDAQSVYDWMSEQREYSTAMEIDYPDVPEPPVIPGPSASNTSTGGKSSDQGGPSTPSNQPEKENNLPGWIYKDDRYGHWTVGFQLELPIAVYRRGGLLADPPHPHDRRWEAEEIVTDYMPSERIKKITVDRFIAVLNAQTDMVFIDRDEDEDLAIHDLRMENLHRLEHGLPPLEHGITGNSPSQASNIRPISELAKNAARQGLGMLIHSYFNNSEPARNLMLASGEEIRDAMNRAIMPGIPGPTDRRDAEEHLVELLHLEQYRLRRDKRHIPLAGMRPRYRAFSVYAIDEVNLDCVERRHYRNFPPNWVAPKELYGWVTIKISSPVMAFKWPPTELEKTVTDICRVVRDNFRVHREMPWIPATTQISVSHSSGLTLKDIQKLSSFLAIEAVFNDLRRFNRWYRTGASHDKVCGPIRIVSQLAKLAHTSPSADNFDDNKIVPLHGPLRTEQLKEVSRTYLPIDMMLQTESLAGRIFHAMIWQYTDIDAIVAAVGTGYRSRKTEVMIKCRGAKAVGESAKSTPEYEMEQEDLDHDQKFFQVDKQRGVFEFRQMGGSLDPSHIMAWLIVCHRITEFMRTSTPAQYRFALEQIIRDRVPVMEAINIPVEARQFLESHIGQSGYLESEFDPNDNNIDWRDPFYPPYPK